MLVNIVQCVLFLSVTGYAVVLFWQVVYRRYLYIKLGQPVQIQKEIKFRLKAATLQIFGQTKLLKDPKSGRCVGYYFARYNWSRSSYTRL